MVSVALKIPDEFESMMDKLPWVNWSELAREEFLSRLKKEKALKRLSKLMKGSEMTEELAMRLGEELKERISKRIKGD